MIDDQQLDEYLKRIDLNHPTDGCTAEYLNQLQVGHLTHIPFETFDLIDIKELNISLDDSFHRLVRQKRGGVCCQMNGVFSTILKKLNYNAKLIACTVFLPETKAYATDESHLSIHVRLNNGITYLCDVGYFNDFLTPLFFRTDCIQHATNGFFRLKKSEDGLYYELQRGYLNSNENVRLLNPLIPQTYIVDIEPERFKWINSYRFSTDFLNKSTEVSDCQNSCSSILYSPDVILNHCTMVRMSKIKPNVGNYMIIGKDYIDTIFENGIETRHRYPISENDDGLKKLLKEKFNLVIDRNIQLVDK